jgi:FAD/FMN-containing dehydrogenase
MDNSSLTSLNGLGSLTSIESCLNISNNTLLTDLTGLNGLTNINYSLQLYSNNSLISLTGLNNVEAIGGHLEIVGQDALTNLSGLESLITVYGEFIIAQNEKQSNDFWKFRESLTEAQKLDGKLIGFDISIPINNMDLFFQEAKKELKKILPNIKFHTFGHLGDSNIHFNLIEPDNLKENFYSYEKAFKNVINKILIKVKGSVSAEHGIGLLKKDDLKITKSISEITIMKKIKKLFDPNNILNQKKIF